MDNRNPVILSSFAGLGCFGLFGKRLGEIKLNQNLIEGPRYLATLSDLKILHAARFLARFFKIRPTIIEKKENTYNGTWKLPKTLVSFI